MEKPKSLLPLVALVIVVIIGLVFGNSSQTEAEQTATSEIEEVSQSIKP